MTHRLAPWIVAVALALGLATAQPASAGQLPPPPTEGWSVTLSERYEPLDFVIALYERGDSPDNRLELFHPETGEWMATIRTSTAPMVVRRPSAGQLLVSDYRRFPRGDGTFDIRERLLVFDMADELKLLREISIPSRASYIFYWPGGFGLSGDERYLFYLDSDTPDVESFRVPGLRWLALDLEHPDASAIPIETAAPCDWPITPGPGSTAAVSCGGPTLISGAGEVIEEGASTQTGVPFRTEDGTLGAISTHDGRVEALRATGERGRAHALPEGAQQLTWAAAPDGRIILGYRTRCCASNDLQGFTLFDPVALDTVVHMRIAIRDVVPNADGSGAYLLLDEGIYVVEFEPQLDMRPLRAEPPFPAHVRGNDDYEWQNWALIP